MSFGNQTITFVTLVGTGVFDDLGFEPTTPTDVPVEGCHHRPLSAAEASEIFGNVAKQIWKTTAPPEAAAVAAKSTGVLKEGDRVFHIIGGAQAFRDFQETFKVTILSEIQEEI